MDSAVSERKRHQQSISDLESALEKVSGRFVCVN